MRVLFLPLNSHNVVQDGIYDAFRALGHDLEIFDFNTLYESKRRRQNQIRAEFINTAVRFRPDLIFMQIQHTNIIDPRSVQEVKEKLPGVVVAQWTGDVRSRVPDTYRRMAAVCQHNFISSTGQLEMFKQAIGKEAKYLQIGYNPKLYYPGSTGEFQWDCIFTANYNKRENYPGTSDRERVSQLLRANFKERFALFGDLWPKQFGSRGGLNQRELTRTYHKSFCLISVSHFNDIPHYFSDRLLMCLATGRPVVSLKFPKWESYFVDRGDIVIANSVEEIPQKVKWLLENKDWAEEIGKAGAAKVQAEHTYVCMVRKLLTEIGL